jgi:hypothetical protein
MVVTGGETKVVKVLAGAGMTGRGAGDAGGWASATFTWGAITRGTPPEGWGLRVGGLLAGGWDPRTYPVANADPTSTTASTAASAAAAGAGSRKPEWGNVRRAQAASRHPPPRARAEGMLEETSGSVPAPTAMLPVKSATVWATRTLSHCCNSSGERIAWPDRELRSTTTC